MRLKVIPRLYQEKIFNAITKENTLVVLPTGLGKTIIAFMLILHKLKKDPESKIIFLAPTKPICEQHLRNFLEKVECDKKAELMTGLVKPERRKELWEKSNIFFATPQTVSNDIIKGYIDLNKVSLMIFDECHRAREGYDYTFIARVYRNKNKYGHILGLTASPGDTAERIEEIKRNLFVSKIETINEESPEIKEYIKSKKVKKIFIELPEGMRDLKELFEKALKIRLNELKKENVIESSDINKVRKTELLKLQGMLIKEKEFDKLSKVTECIKILYCLELLQMHGISSLTEFITNLKKQVKKVRATKRLFEDITFREAVARAYELESKNFDHPKFEKLKEILEKEKKDNVKIMIFTQYVVTAKKLYEKVKEIEGINAAIFMGQRKGYTQKKQLEIIKKFAEGNYNVLIATSIGEEGIDIKNADLGIFFEPVPSALRMIQRKGRIGRFNLGKIIVLITKDTIDEKYYWVAYHKERRMKEIIAELANPQRRLDQFG